MSSEVSTPSRLANISCSSLEKQGTHATGSSRKEKRAELVSIPLPLLHYQQSTR